MWGLTSPWTALRDKQKKYVLDEDLPFIEEHNAEFKSGKFKIELDVVPEPFIGNPGAPLWLLNLNPGFRKADLHHTPETIVMQKKSAALKADEFWFIDDRYKTAPGYGWWTAKLGALIRDYKLEQVKKKVFCVELFPYHSVNYKWRKRRQYLKPAQGKGREHLLPSQLFTLDLVRRAVANGKKFIIMRRYNEWISLVKDLEHSRHTLLKNPEGAWISKTNLRDPSILDEVFGKLKT